MTKADLINGIAEKLKYPKKTVTPIVEEVFNSIKAHLRRARNACSYDLAFSSCWFELSRYEV